MVGARRLALSEARLDAISQVEERREGLETELLEIGAALAEERDLRALLERILTAARTLVSADAGSLYLAEERTGRDPVLRFALAQNDSCAASWRESTVLLDRCSIAGMAAVTGEALSIEDAYDLPANAPFSFNPAFDTASGYRTRSLLAVPLVTRKGEVLGVVQLINRKRRSETKLRSAEDVEREAVPFTEQDLALLRSLANQAAIVLDNARLVREIQNLFESFVEASITAVEQRDPPTSGHSLRVADYTLALARAIDRETKEPFAPVRWSRDELQQLRYAALLHDVGKLGVREAVLTKEKKLYPDQARYLTERFWRACRAEQLAASRRLLEELVRTGTKLDEEDLLRLGRELARIRDEVESRLADLDRANQPVLLTEALAGSLEEISRRRFPGPHGEPLPWLEPEELRLLLVSRGNLDERERAEIESHVVNSFHFLMKLPWPRHLERIPEIVALHHEKLDGGGYPRGLHADEISIEVRMLTLCDVYDALTASDRPYKPSLGRERALEILRKEGTDGALDPTLVKLFIEARVFQATEGPSGG